MRSVSAVAAAAVLCCALSGASAASQLDAAMNALCDALAAPATVSYTGMVEAIRIGREFSEASVYRIEHRAPDLTRRTYTAPAALEGESILTRGATDYVIDPKRRHIGEAPNDSPEVRSAYARDTALIRANYRAEERDGDQFAGRATLSITAIDRFTDRPLLVLRVDRETKLVLDRQEFDVNGSLRSESHFDVVRFVNAPMSDFAIPADYSITRTTERGRSNDVARVTREAGFDARAPRQLAEGFVPLEADGGAPNGVRDLHVLYSDGVRTLSLFESAASSAPDMAPFHPQPVMIQGRAGEYAIDGSTGLLTWSDTARCYTLVGELALTELQRIAASIGL